MFRGQMRGIELVTVVGPGTACLIYVSFKQFNKHLQTPPQKNWDPASVSPHLWQLLSHPVVTTPPLPFPTCSWPPPRHG